MKLTIIFVFFALVLFGNSLYAQRYDSKITEKITTFYIDAITLSHDSIPRTNIDINSNANSILSNNYYVVVANRNLIVFAQDGYKAGLINISGLTIQSKLITNGKTNFNVNLPGVYLVKISSRNNKTTLLKTIVL